MLLTPRPKHRCKNRLSPGLPHAGILTLPMYCTAVLLLKSSHFEKMLHVIFYMLHITPWYMLSMYSTAVLKSSHLRADLCAVLSLICRVVLMKMMRKRVSYKMCAVCSVQCALCSLVCSMMCSTAAPFTRCARHFHRGSLLAFSPHHRRKPSS